MNKRGWIHILEATIAVLIVAGVMVSVYDDQSAREVLSIEDYSYSLQNEILEGIAENRTLRLDAMKVVVDLPTDHHYDVLDSYVATKIPENFGYVLRVCRLGDLNDYCKMEPIIFYATIDKDVYVEEAVVSAEVGEGGGEEEYSPKKLKLFFWEGGFPDDYCRDECRTDGEALFCSTDSTKVLRNACGEFDNNDSCLESGTGVVEVEDCSASGKICVDGECAGSLFWKRVCPKRDYVYCDACDINPYLLCENNGYGWWDSGDCHHGDDDEYTCYNFAGAWESDCLSVTDTLPSCPTNLSACVPSSSYPAKLFYEPADSRTESCVPSVCTPTIWTPVVDLSTVCSTDSVPQISNCGTTRNVVGEKNCVCVDGTLVGQCSTTKPFSCSSGLLLVPSCSTCGCSSGTCNVASGNCGGVAVLSASYSNLRYNEGINPGCFAGNDKWIHFDMAIEETGGSVSATLGSRKRCYYGSDGNSRCDSLSTTMPASFGTNIVPAGESLIGTNRWFCLKSGFSYDVTETFYSDSLGNNPIVDYTISVSV